MLRTAAVGRTSSATTGIDPVIAAYARCFKPSTADGLNAFMRTLCGETSPYLRQGSKGNE